MHRHGALPADRQLTMSSGRPKVAWRPLTAVRSPSLSVLGGAPKRCGRPPASRRIEPAVLVIRAATAASAPTPTAGETLLRYTGCQRGGIRTFHVGHLRVPAQPERSAVRHRPSAALSSTRCVSSAVGVATFGLSSSTYTPHWMVHRVQPAVSVESLRRLAAVRFRTNGSTTRVGPPGPAWANTNGFVPQ